MSTDRSNEREFCLPPCVTTSTYRQFPPPFVHGTAHQCDHHRAVLYRNPANQPAPTHSKFDLHQSFQTLAPPLDTPACRPPTRGVPPIVDLSSSEPAPRAVK